MPSILTRAILALLLTTIAFAAAIAFSRRRRSVATIPLAAAAGFFVIVAVAHLCEALNLFPAFGWGRPHTIGHYIDLTAALAGGTMLVVSFLSVLLDRSGTRDQMTSEIDLIRRLYERFNARDMDALSSMMVEDVVWANGMEGGYVHGRDAVRAYWTRQWGMIDPHVDPIRFSMGANGEIVVEVRQVVRHLDGRIASEKMVHHVFRTRNGRIECFDIDSRVP